MHIKTEKMTMDRRKFFAAAMGAGGLFFTEAGAICANTQPHAVDH
jgi:hypothetical protein